MTALEDEEKSKVPEMIEALSQQIHYIIGPMPGSRTVRAGDRYCPEICVSVELQDQR